MAENYGFSNTPGCEAPSGKAVTGLVNGAVDSGSADNWKMNIKGATKSAEQSKPMVMSGNTSVSPKFGAPLVKGADKNSR